MPPSLHGVPSGRFPRFSGTTRHSDFPSFIPPRFVAFAWRYRSRVRCFVSPAVVGRPGRRPGVVIRGSPPGTQGLETTGSPRFLGSPDVDVPCSSTPVGPARQAKYGVPVLPSAKTTTSAPTRTVLSRLNSRARLLAVYASPPGLPPNDARLASGCWPALPSGVGYPLGSVARFQVILSSLPRLCLAHGLRQ
jgi:hypothetical protein